MLDLKKFAQELDDEANLYLNENNYSFSQAFTHSLTERLKDSLGLDNYTIAYGVQKTSDGKISGEIFGYALSSNNEVLTLIYSIYNDNAQNEILTLRDSDYQSAINRMQGYYNKCCSGVVTENTPQDHPLYELAELLYSPKTPKRGRPSTKEENNIVTVRFLVFSNSFIKNVNIKKSRIKGRNLIPEVYDISRLYQLYGSDSDHRIINIDFEEDYKFKLPYIEMDAHEFGYKCFLTMFPGKLLYKLYDEYNTDLLLNNVRYFLGFKGSFKNNANIGIQETLRTKKHMFLAYNNGIVALAESIETISHHDSTDIDPEEISNDSVTSGILKSIKDFQIINGGQTTASLFYAKNSVTSEPITMIGVYVPVKIIVINNSENKKAVAADITKFSNSQSKVKYADFSASNPYNMKMQELSRNIKTNSGVQWYYERLRGQYEQDYKKIKTAESQQLFKSLYNKKERLFTKELLAKVWKCKLNTPYDVVKGEGTNYDLFLKHIVENNIIPDEDYYKKSIALLMLWNYIYNIPEVKSQGNCRAPLTAYTLAYLLNNRGREFNLIKIWNDEKIDTALSECIIKLSRAMLESLNIIATEAQKSILSCSKVESTYREIKNRGVHYDYNSIENFYL